MPVGALHGAGQQLLVLEPDGDRGERGVVPGLPVGEALVELADQVRGLVGDDRHALGDVVRRAGRSPAAASRPRGSW